MQKNKLLLRVILFLFIVSMVGCKIGEFFGDCGAKIRDAQTWIADDYFEDSTNPTVYSEGIKRVFQFRIYSDNICTGKPALIKANTNIEDNPPTAILVRARVELGLTSTTTIDLVPNDEDTYYEGEVEIEMLPAFPTGSAWFTSIIEIYFDTRGSLDEDKSYFKQYVEDVYLKNVFKNYKEP